MTRAYTVIVKQKNRKEEENLITIHVINLHMSPTVTNIGVCVTII